MNWRAASPYLLSMLRIVVAFMFFQVGSAKVFAFPAAVMPGGGTAAGWSLAWIAGMLEVVGGAFLLVGLFTRPVAFVLSGFMAVAYVMAHASRGNPLLPMLNGGELAVFYCFTFLYFVFSGAGTWSVDAVWRHSKAA